MLRVAQAVRLVLPLLLCGIVCSCPRHRAGGGGAPPPPAPIPSSGFKADLAVHMEPTGMFMGKPSGMAGQLPYPDWKGAVYWTANQARVDEFSTRDGSSIVRSYISDTGALSHYTFSPNAANKQAKAWWLKGGDPLPGRGYNAWAAKLPFCALGLGKDFILSQLQASPAIQVRDLGTQTIQGEPCEGIAITTGSPPAIPGDGPAEVWFSLKHGVAWKVECTTDGGSNRYVIELSNAAPWTPDATLLALPAGFTLADMRK